jgi:hypothetical protein
MHLDTFWRPKHGAASHCAQSLTRIRSPKLEVAQMKSLIRLCLALLVGALAACGGGGGGGEDSNTFELEFAVPSLTFRLFAGDTVVEQQPVSGTVSGGSSAATVYVRVVDSGTAFGGAPIIVGVNGSSFTTHLAPSTSLAAGTYTGTLTAELCKDSACTTKYDVSGGSLPYSVTVSPLLNIEVLVNGSSTLSVTSTPPTPVQNLHVASGSTIEIRSNIAVTVDAEEVGAWFIQIDPSSTEKVFRAVLTANPDTSGPAASFIAFMPTFAPSDNSRYAIVISTEVLRPGE